MRTNVKIPQHNGLDALIANNCTDVLEGSMIILGTEFPQERAESEARDTPINQAVAAYLGNALITGLLTSFIDILSPKKKTLENINKVGPISVVNSKQEM